MSTPVFITFEDSLIEVNEIACERVQTTTTYELDLAWEIVIYLKSGSYTTYRFETKIEAQNAHAYFRQLVTEAITGYSFDGRKK